MSTAGPLRAPDPSRVSRGTGDVWPVPLHQVSWFVPGRIEVLGKHTDYAGGRSLLAATRQGLTFNATARTDRLLRVTSEALRTTAEVDLDRPGRDRRGDWSGYPAAVGARLMANFGQAIRGADVTVDGDLPRASGLSSSSALVVGVARVLMDLAGLGRERALTGSVTRTEELADYLAAIENGQTYRDLAGRRSVGTQGGSEDHVAMCCARSGMLGQYSFCPAHLEREVPLPRDHALVVAVSGVLAEKSGEAREAFNRLARASHEVVDRWDAATGRTDLYLAGAVRSSPDAPDRIRKLLAGHGFLRGRFEQFLAESERIVPAAADALAARDLDTFGALVDESQRWSEEGLDNQIPETVALQRLARQMGATAASTFGAGFGGSVWALVPAADAEDFAQDWLAAYLRPFSQHAAVASVLVTEPSGPARRLTLTS